MAEQSKDIKEMENGTVSTQAGNEESNKQENNDKLFTQEEMDKILDKRFAREREKQEQAIKEAEEKAKQEELEKNKSLEEKIADMQKQLTEKEKQEEANAIKAEFQKRLVDSNIDAKVRDTLLANVDVNKMSDFDLTPFIDIEKAKPIGNEKSINANTDDFFKGVLNKIKK